VDAAGLPHHRKLKDEPRAAQCRLILLTPPNGTEMPSTHRVFVYGTLKNGFSNYYLLKGSEFFGDAVTVPTYKMIENGFPVVMPDPAGKPLAGEIYAVDDGTLARLDQLEREGSSYDRKLIDVTLSLASGEQLPTNAFIYVGREDRFGKAFARGPLYETLNQRGELVWKLDR
jgi:gamma-glutamylcyclotransferase (GGCT)/AIG2-like uncharacterized protein YtfP